MKSEKNVENVVNIENVYENFKTFVVKSKKQVNHSFEIRQRNTFENAKPMHREITTAGNLSTSWGRVTQ